MKSMMTAKLLAAASLTALTLGAGTARAETWRYAFEEAMDEVQGKYAQKFKEEVEANSDHEVQLFPFGTLGESADIMEQAQSGILQFVDQSPGFTGALIPEAQVFFVPYLLPAGPTQVSCSIGIAEGSDPGESGTDLIDRADAALYQAKASGKNRLFMQNDRSTLPRGVAVA